MSFWRQLRWQMIVSHLIVVIVGVSILLLATRLTISNATSTSIQPSLRALMQAEGTVAIETSIDVVIGTFQEAVASSLSIAAFSSILAGIATSLWLTNQILRPLRQITQSSQRIADGHYQERVSIPNSDELAQVALNFNQMAESLEEIESQRIKLIGMSRTSFVRPSQALRAI
ncbi:MAG: HAMP domain-containing protein [Chloroflexota bacterium]